MSEISQNIPPVPQTENVEDLRVYIERELSRMQNEIYSLRQFLEPIVKGIENTPNMVFSPIT